MMIFTVLHFCSFGDKVQNVAAMEGFMKHNRHFKSHFYLNWFAYQYNYLYL